MCTGHIFSLAALSECILHIIDGFSPPYVVPEAAFGQFGVRIQRAIFPQLAEVLDVAGFGFSGWEGQV